MSDMDPAEEFGRRAWCAAGLVAWTLIASCAGTGLASGVPAPDGVAVTGSVAVDRFGGRDSGAPLAMPPVVEAEIAEDDVDPRGSSERSWPSPVTARRIAAAAAVAGQDRRDAHPAVLVANAADLSRLCRLLC